MRYDHIQAMRGLAALLVVLMHIQMFGNGAFGAELFFCISGFITMHVTKTSSHAFLQKRAIRIIPLYWGVTLATVVLLIVAPSVFRSSTFQLSYLVKSMLFIPYDAKGFVALVSVGWTLILEVYFYILFFTASLLNRKYRHYITSAVLIIAVLIGYVFQGFDNPYIQFYCQPVILEFVLGMFSYEFLTKRTTPYKPATKILCLIGAVIGLSALFVTRYIPALETIDRFYKWGILAFAVFVLLFVGLSNSRIPKPFILLGDISYSIYLTHSYIVQGFSRLVYNIDTYSLFGVVLTVCVVIPLVLLVAYISWWLIEQKLTNALKSVLLKPTSPQTNPK